MRVLDRAEEVAPEGALADLLWSDPENIETWGVSPRGAGYLFGYKVTQQFNRINGFELICRAHQLVQEGFCYSFRDHSVLTIWSAPNYCYRCGNLASVLILNERMEREFHIFREVYILYYIIIYCRIQKDNLFILEVVVFIII